MKRVAFAMGLLLAVAPGASGQSVPNIMKPKQAAARAVAATNRAVEANSTLPAESADTGAKRKADIDTAYQKIYPLLEECKKTAKIENN